MKKLEEFKEEDLVGMSLDELMEFAKQYNPNFYNAWIRIVTDSRKSGNTDEEIKHGIAEIHKTLYGE